MRVFAGKKVGPIYLGVSSGSFHPYRVLLNHGSDRVPSPLAWFVVLAAFLFTFGSYWLSLR